MGIKRKTFEFIKYYKLTEPSHPLRSITVCGEGEKDFPITNDTGHVWIMITLPTYTICTVASFLLQLLNFQIKDFIYLYFVPHR